MRAALGAAVAAAVVGSVAVPPASATDDPYFDRQWNLVQIGAPAAWATTTGAGVSIGLVDTGIDAGHPEFAGKVDAQADCLGGTCREGSAPDDEGHGTAVAGIAAANAGNGTGIAGVAPGAHLVVAKALDGDGAGTTVDINNAIQWVVDHGARIVNLSLGDADLVYVSRVGTSLKSGIEYAWSRGAIPVLASGNYEGGSGEGSFNYGNLDAVVVGATTRTGATARYSTELGNAKWGLLAPGGSGDGAGEDIPSPARNGRYVWDAGTSMAAPHVSGTLALLLAMGLSPSAAVERLLATTNQGRLRADAAVASAASAASAAPAASSPSAPGTVSVRAAGLAPAQGTSGDLNPGLVALAIGLIVCTAAGAALVAGQLRPPRGLRQPA